MLKTTELTVQGPARGSKLKMSIEKRLENIWLESEQRGWSYNDFVTHLLEVLVVLNYRSFPRKIDESQNSFEKATAP